MAIALQPIAVSITSIRLTQSAEPHPSSLSFPPFAGLAPTSCHHTVEPVRQLAGPAKHENIQYDTPISGYPLQSLAVYTMPCPFELGSVYIAWHTI